MMAIVWMGKLRHRGRNHVGVYGKVTADLTSRDQTPNNQLAAS